MLELLITPSRFWVFLLPKPPEEKGGFENPRLIRDGKEYSTQRTSGCPAAKKSRKATNDLYLQFWPKPSFVDSSRVYASHADDVYMLFGYPFLYPLLATDIERKTSLRMIGALAAFANEG
ncbi:hypothetical protein HPB47_009426 [Ixodes persulcatus]|uniref:Uncharacterized protein n=1 Tax=Ixodes persulcatus TaxID=34615 RepID=A0AC60P1X2_IXOPE|nr:hypothetical protein HPB47_009426 [Ixodes persulcatus]